MTRGFITGWDGWVCLVRELA